MRASLFLHVFLSNFVNVFCDGPDGVMDDGQVALSLSAFAGTHSLIIVIFKEGTTRVAMSLHLEWLNSIHLEHESLKIDLRNPNPAHSCHGHFGGVKHTFDIGGIFLSYSGQFRARVVEQVARSPDVKPLSQVLSCPRCTDILLLCRIPRA